MDTRQYSYWEILLLDEMADTHTTQTAVYATQSNTNTEYLRFLSRERERDFDLYFLSRERDRRLSLLRDLFCSRRLLRESRLPEPGHTQCDK